MIDTTDTEFDWQVQHCATRGRCGIGYVIEHMFCKGTECKDYVPKEPTVGAQSDGRHNPITELSEREAT